MTKVVGQQYYEQLYRFKIISAYGLELNMPSPNYFHWHRSVSQIKWHEPFTAAVNHEVLSLPLGNKTISLTELMYLLSLTYSFTICRNNQTTKGWYLIKLPAHCTSEVTPLFHKILTIYCFQKPRYAVITTGFGHKYPIRSNILHTNVLVLFILVSHLHSEPMNRMCKVIWNRESETHYHVTLYNSVTPADKI